MTIRALVRQKEKEGLTSLQIAKALGVTTAMISTYRQQNYMPSLKTARSIYKAFNVVIYPYSIEAVSSKGWGYEFD